MPLGQLPSSRLSINPGPEWGTTCRLYPSSLGRTPLLVTVLSSITTRKEHCASSLHPPRLAMNAPAQEAVSRLPIYPDDEIIGHAGRFLIWSPAPRMQTSPPLVGGPLPAGVASDKRWKHNDASGGTPDPAVDSWGLERATIAHG
ncbi:hypothetical protein N7539_009229 [Penicillium diatomitis]|uniref:Uncharacterized protein n=1 Tax=Penicillium diatomitis TaxID=2819901 RepID=A0A9X0BJH6_9EURO|nr:uncharacterized protein N7539_009229 [Penicillium diatomitis]KAJ5469611.1 hypothetical protein N7539_009229 [Penicillium diatomitis]